jgi:hypothetical protein
VSRRAFVVLFVLVLAAAAAWRPRPAAPPSNPSLALAATSDVPAPVLDVLHRACFDCHSNETRWPWYSRLPAVSWLLAHDVTAARAQMNFSEWGGYNPFDRADLLDHMCDLTTHGRMPAVGYRLLHRDARLSALEVSRLCDWTSSEGDRLVQVKP